MCASAHFVRNGRGLRRKLVGTVAYQFEASEGHAVGRCNIPFRKKQEVFSKLRALIVPLTPRYCPKVGTDAYNAA